MILIAIPDIAKLIGDRTLECPLFHWTVLSALSGDPEAIYKHHLLRLANSGTCKTVGDLAELVYLNRLFGLLRGDYAAARDYAHRLSGNGCTLKHLVVVDTNTIAVEFQPLENTHVDSTLPECRTIGPAPYAHP